MVKVWSNSDQIVVKELNKLVKRAGQAESAARQGFDRCAAVNTGQNHWSNIPWEKTGQTHTGQKLRSNTLVKHRVVEQTVK